ncbi:MAG: dicarboxylate/amino acid:cation symporter, partial [Silvanigrellaceae bacterium]|nr:dicarboxylate/amino acid:cation symporter [Silvanigrellaceae bacterium]
MPFILLAIIVLSAMFHSYMPIDAKSILYSLSLWIKSVLIFILPYIIFSLLFKTAVTFAKKATKIIFFILIAVCLSNFVSTFLSHFVGDFIFNLNLSLAQPKEHQQHLLPYWQDFQLPKLIANDKAMFAGLILGIFTSLVKADLAKYISQFLEKLVGRILGLFTFVIPIFIAGFVVKLSHDEVIFSLIKDYGPIFGLIVLSQFLYIVLLYFLVNRFSFSRAIISMKNIFPAAVTGFSTMSSAAAMPLTIVGAARNAA